MSNSIESPNTYVVTAVVGEEFVAPKRIDVSGCVVELQEVAIGIGITKNGKVMFQGEKSGDLRELETSEATKAFAKKQSQPCSKEGCLNRMIGSNLCWDCS